MNRFARGLVAGFLIPWRGLGLIFSDRRIARFAILPIVATILFLGTGLAIGLPIITGWVTPIATWIVVHLGIASTSVTASVLGFLLPIAIWPTLAIGVCLIAWILARVAVGPLFILLAEAVLVSGGTLEKKDFQLIEWTATNVRMIRVSLARALLLGSFGFVCLLVSLIPGIGVVGALALLILLATDLMDYALEALEWDFQQRMSLYRRHFSVFLGFGLILGLVFLIPGLNFFLLPASVAGASDVVRRLVATDPGS